MVVKQRKLDMPAVDEIELDSSTSDGDCDWDEEVCKGAVNAQGLPHGRGTMT